MFGEMYLQKRDEYAGGELTGANPDGNPYKGIMRFMIAGLKENVPFVVKDIPETGISHWNLRLQYGPFSKKILPLSIDEWWELIGIFEGKVFGK